MRTKRLYDPIDDLYTLDYTFDSYGKAYKH